MYQCVCMYVCVRVCMDEWNAGGAEPCGRGFRPGAAVCGALPPQVGGDGCMDVCIFLGSRSPGIELSYIIIIHTYIHTYKHTSDSISASTPSSQNVVRISLQFLKSN